MDRATERVAALRRDLVDAPDGRPLGTSPVMILAVRMALCAWRRP